MQPNLRNFALSEFVVLSARLMHNTLKKYSGNMHLYIAVLTAQTEQSPKITVLYLPSLFSLSSGVSYFKEHTPPNIKA